MQWQFTKKSSEAERMLQPMRFSIRSRKVIVVLFVAMVIIAVAVYAIESLREFRPIIEYSMTAYAYTEGQINFNPYGPVYTTQMPVTFTYVNSNAPLIVALHWQNKGDADTSLQLTLATENANITWFSNFGSNGTAFPGWATESDGQTYNGASSTFHVSAVAHSPMLYKYVDVLPVGNPQTFTITFSIKDASNNSTALFPSGTITATYEIASPNVYRLVQ
jgi:hypothetical protein